MAEEYKDKSKNANSVGNAFDTSLSDVYHKDIRDNRSTRSSDIPPGIIKQRHVGGEYKVVKFGLAADRPDGSTRTKSFFATDTNVLSMWNGTAWVSVTLS